MSHVSPEMEPGHRERIRFSDLQRRIRLLPRRVTAVLTFVGVTLAIVLKSALEDRVPFSSSLVNTLFVWGVLLAGYTVVCSVVGFALAYLSLRWFPASDEERRSPRAWLIPSRR